MLFLESEKSDSKSFFFLLFFLPALGSSTRRTVCVFVVGFSEVCLTGQREKGRGVVRVLWVFRRGCERLGERMAGFVLCERFWGSFEGCELL